MFSQWNNCNNHYFEDHSYNYSSANNITTTAATTTATTTGSNHNNNHNHNVNNVDLLHSHKVSPSSTVMSFHQSNHLQHSAHQLGHYDNAYINNGYTNNEYSFTNVHLANGQMDYLSETNNNDYNNNNINNSLQMSFISPPSVTSPTMSSFSASPSPPTPTPDTMWDLCEISSSGQYIRRRDSVSSSTTMSHTLTGHTIIGLSSPVTTPTTPNQATMHTSLTTVQTTMKPINRNKSHCKLDNSKCNPKEQYNQLQTSESNQLASKYPTFQATKRQLIKEGLKVTIQSKRMAMGLSTIKSEDLKKSQVSSSNSTFQAMSTEDEERRRRRRERNKVAATKCRNKKKYHVCKLSEESETLEVVNSNLREEILHLEEEQQKLLDALNTHLPCCQNRQFMQSIGHTRHSHSHSHSMYQQMVASTL